MKKLAILGGLLVTLTLLAGGVGAYYFMSSKVEPEGLKPLAPTASEAPKANFSGQVADRRGDAATQVALPEDVKMPTDIDIKAPPIPDGIADPAGDKK